jgi:hypothetical protein
MAEKTRSEFAHFYATDLLAQLRPLEEARKKVLGQVLILVAVAGGLIAIALALDLAYRLSGWLTIVSIAGIGGIATFIYRFLISEYVASFKLGVISKIVAFIEPGLEYSPTGNIGQGQFMMSNIFRREPDRFRGDDHVWGKIGDTQAEFSEVHAEYKTESYSSRGRRRTWHTIFRGLFFIADFNKEFRGRTVVLPDTAEKLLGEAGAFFQSLNKGRGELIKLEDPEFEKMFVVYGDDQVESRYILSTSLMRRIVEFRKKTGRPLCLSFVGSRVFVAVSYRKRLFEPRVFTSILNFKSAETYFDDLSLAVGIVADLGLNTRIWSKQPSP